MCSFAGVFQYCTFAVLCFTMTLIQIKSRVWVDIFIYVTPPKERIVFNDTIWLYCSRRLYTEVLGLYFWNLMNLMIFFTLRFQFFYWKNTECMSTLISNVFHMISCAKTTNNLGFFGFRNFFSIIIKKISILTQMRNHYNYFISTSGSKSTTLAGCRFLQAFILCHCVTP